MSTRKRKPGKGRAGRKGGQAAEYLRFYEQNWPLINYLVPAYGDHGENQTLIGLDGGSVHLEPYRIKTALNRLGRVFSLNLADLRKRCGRIVARSHTTPLVIAPGLVLLPLRVRSPRFRDDGATGYVVYHKIKQIVPIPQTNASRLVFQDGTELVVLQRTSSLDRIFGEAFRVVQGIGLLYNANSSVSKDVSENDSNNNPRSDPPSGGFAPGINGAINFNYPVVYLEDTAENVGQLPKRENRTGPRMAMVQVPVIIYRKTKCQS